MSISRREFLDFLKATCAVAALPASVTAQQSSNAGQSIAHGKAKRVKLHNDAEATKKEVLKRIPIGSSIEHARDVMKMSSFKCELMRDELFASDCEGSDSRKGDFLYCDRVKFAFPFFERRWQILIFHANGLVADVLVCLGLTGP